MSTTALSLLASQLRLQPAETEALEALLRASPVALQAEATSIPVAALLEGAGAAARPDVAVRQLTEALLQPRTITVGSISVSLSLITQWVWTEGAMLVQFQFNPMLCRMLREFAAERDIPPF